MAFCLQKKHSLQQLETKQQKQHFYSYLSIKAIHIWNFG